jgi:hypothetical protein
VLTFHAFCLLSTLDLHRISLECLLSGKRTGIAAQFTAAQSLIKKHSAGYLQHSDEVSSPSARMGHHAMPMLWGEQMLGWANLKAVDRRLQQIGF